MTDDEKRKCLAWIAARRDKALRLGLMATAKSWQEFYFHVGSRPAEQMILGRALGDFDVNDASTTP
jgi:hypothetical protein